MINFGIILNFTQLTCGFATFKNISKNLDNTTNYALNLNNFNHTRCKIIITEELLLFN